MMPVSVIEDASSNGKMVSAEKVLPFSMNLTNHWYMWETGIWFATFQ